MRFVAGGSELANAEVEPSLLSLVCRELNTVRLSAGPRRDLGRPAGGLARHDPHGVLRAGARRPARRRAARDRGRAAHGVRLSREPGRGARDEGAGRRRCGAGCAREAGGPPPAAHRGAARHAPRGAHARRAVQRRARAAATCATSARRATRPSASWPRSSEREAETHRTLVRTRRVALVSAVLMLVAVASAVFGWVNYRRAHQARPRGAAGARRCREARRVPDRGLLRRARADRPAGDHGQARAHGRRATTTACRRN